MNKKQNIPTVFILEEINFGGTQRQMIEMINHLDKNIFKPEIWTLRDSNDLMPLAQKYNITVRQLCNKKVLNPIFAIPALLKALLKYRPSIIHLHTTFPNIWGRILGRICKIPVIIGSVRSKRNIAKQKERRLWSLAHAHTCNAQSLYNKLLSIGLPKSRLYNIANGVDTDVFKPAESGLCKLPKIITVGRLVKEKNQAMLLQAFAKVLQSVPDAELHIVGTGYMLDDLQKLSNDLKISAQVIFHGASSNVSEYLQSSRVFAFSSIDEGTPNAIIEAMATGLPIVSTGVDGIPALVTKEKHGLLVGMYDDDALAKALIRTLQNPNLAEAMGKNGRQHIEEHYSFQSMARQHEAVYIEYYKKFLVKSF